MNNSQVQSLRFSLYSAAQVRELDRIAIEDFKIPGLVLMKRAGLALYEVLCEMWPDDNLTVFCGTGNNAGDGYVVAKLARQQNRPIRVIQVGDVEKLRGDAKSAYDEASATGVEIIPFSECINLEQGVVVDALLGTGVTGQIREPVAHVINVINNSQLPVIAVDIPSGLCSDTGMILGAAIKADAVVSFIGLKKGLFTGSGTECVKEVFFDDLDVPTEAYDQLNQQDSIQARLTCLSDRLSFLAPRQRNAHKGNFGHVLIVGGDKSMGGAVAMAAEAALRVGSGLVSVATRPEHVAALLARRPELMVSGVVSGQELEPLLQKVSVVVIGPGLGLSPWSEQLLQQVVASNVPMVVDADALNLIAKGVFTLPTDSRLVITPHPGEAAKLLAVENSDIQADRFNAVSRLCEKFNCTTVLKGAGSLVSDGITIELSCLGNPGMASGGMGDVLSGIIGGLMAQGLSPFDSAVLGVNLHGAAADEIAEQNGERGMLATDLFEKLQYLVNP